MYLLSFYMKTLQVFEDMYNNSLSLWHSWLDIAIVSIWLFSCLLMYILQWGTQHIKPYPICILCEVQKNELHTRIQFMQILFFNSCVKLLSIITFSDKIS